MLSKLVRESDRMRGYDRAVSSLKINFENFILKFFSYVLFCIKGCVCAIFKYCFPLMVWSIGLLSKWWRFRWIWGGRGRSWWGSIWRRRKRSSKAYQGGSGISRIEAKIKRIFQKAVEEGHWFWSQQLPREKEETSIWQVSNVPIYPYLLYNHLVDSILLHWQLCVFDLFILFLCDCF